METFIRRQKKKTDTSFNSNGVSAISVNFLCSKCIYLFTECGQIPSRNHDLLRIVSMSLVKEDGWGIGGIRGTGEYRSTSKNVPMPRSLPRRLIGARWAKILKTEIRKRRENERTPYLSLCQRHKNCADEEGEAANKFPGPDCVASVFVRGSYRKS